jgi:PPOX class probable F420-dependent enzyme
MVDIPQGYETLLERPLYGHLATTRPGGNAQVNPMWFDWDGELLRFTHTTKRQKYRNVTANPNVAMSISDPDNPYRYLEVRGGGGGDRARSHRRVLPTPQRPI